ncbi:MAG TPA: 50S ribosomal protein L21 [bacterium]|nr:50S ribosomal protein L21 [bacterium]
MFAVIETGGKQYRVAKDSIIDVEKLAANPGDSVDLTQVLLVSDGSDVNTGNPYLPGAVVKATVMDQHRGKKIRVFKMKPKKRYRRLQGHRQYYTRIRIDDIVVG